MAAPDTADNVSSSSTPSATSASSASLTHRYRGRFAPSPTGPLHIGSIVAALASYLDARAVGGEWLVRMEDLDPPREQPGAADDILRMLEALGLCWDGSVVYQSHRHDAYRDALEVLKQQALIFPCQCSRQDLGGIPVYPGTCRQRAPRPDIPTALRCHTPAQTFSFEDRIQGHYAQQLDRDVGDFILLRKEGLFAYQLAVVVDDAWQGITDIVRGMDLLDSTPRQLYLQQQLSLPTPRYAHIPIIVNAEGHKLGKQQFAAAVGAQHPGRTLVLALTYLQQEPEPVLANESIATILQWAIQHWRIDPLRGLQQLHEAAS